jgi:hypothetical protein
VRALGHTRAQFAPFFRRANPGTIEHMASTDGLFAPGTPPYPCVAGVAVLDLTRELEEMIGSEVVALARSALTHEQRVELEEATAVSWVRMSTSSAFIDAVGAVSGRDPEPLVDEAVRRATVRTFKTVWRMLLRLTTDEALVKRTPLIYTRGRNVGQMESRLIAPSTAELLLTRWPDPPPRQMRLIGISVEVVVGLAGRRDVRCDCERKRDGARYLVRWRE